MEFVILYICHRIPMRNILSSSVKYLRRKLYWCDCGMVTNGCNIKRCDLNWLVLIHLNYKSQPVRKNQQIMNHTIVAVHRFGETEDKF